MSWGNARRTSKIPAIVPPIQPAGVPATRPIAPPTNTAAAMDPNAMIIVVRVPHTIIEKTSRPWPSTPMRWVKFPSPPLPARWFESAFRSTQRDQS